MIVMSNPVYDADGLRGKVFVTTKRNLLIDQYLEGLDTVRRKFKQNSHQPKPAQ
jgi:hypothetical protein